MVDIDIDQIRKDIRWKIDDRESRIKELQAEIGGMEKTILELKAENRAYASSLSFMGDGF